MAFESDSKTGETCALLKSNFKYFVQATFWSDF